MTILQTKESKTPSQEFDDADLHNLNFAFNNATSEFNRLEPSEDNVAKILLELRDRIELLMIENSAAGR